jgi:solute carrier family 31 (copper transporter), member 1
VLLAVSFEIYHVLTLANRLKSLLRSVVCKKTPRIVPEATRPSTPIMDHGMTMDMPMDATTTATGAMTSSTGMSDSSDMSMMPMSDMAMTFFTSFRTPLFSDSWMPESEGEYAGTCIFIIALAFILRLLLALRPILETRLWGKTAAAAAASIKKLAEEEDGEGGTLLTKQPRHTLTGISRDVQQGWSGWRVGTAAARATYELTIAGVGYLL